MSERIRVEMTMEVADRRQEFAVETHSPRDAVGALVAAVNEINDVDDEEEFDDVRY